MANQLFRLDLTDQAQDFQKTATEPGLAMLDASGANYAALQRWLGDYAAEPVWLGPNTVSFYVRHEGERVNEPTVAPVTATELEKGLKEPWEELQAKLRKARPETASEQTLQRVATKTLREIANDPEANDASCFLFKYRADGGPWRLAWGWGYQRCDHDPGRGVICRNQQCHHLFVHRQGKRAVCPVCQKVSAPVKGGGVFARVGGLPVATAILALVVLLLLALLFADGSIDVEPNEWSGPYGSEVALKVNHTRYWLFTSDVTDKVVVTSNDPRVVDVEENVGKANGVGSTTLQVRYGEQVADVSVVVTPAKPTVAITIEPDAAKLIVGSTQRIKVIGRTEDGNEIDVTEKTTLSIGDSEIAMLHDGLLQGAKTGQTKLVASYRESAFSEEVRAEVDVDVVAGRLKNLEVAIRPNELRIAEYGRIDVTGVTMEGERYPFNGSTMLDVNVAPDELASLEEQRLRALRSGQGKVTAAIGEMLTDAPFTVASAGLYGDGEFAIAPREANLSVYEYFRVNLLTNRIEDVTAVSSNPAVAEVLDNEHIVAKSPGEATITYTLGDKTDTLKVVVGGASYESIYTETNRIVMRPGQRRLVRLYGRTLGGGRVELAPSSVYWESQPLAEYVRFDRRTGYLTAIAPTPSPQRLLARVGDNLLAEVVVEVVGANGALLVDNSARMEALLNLDSGFVPHPPVTIHDLNTGRFIGRGIVFRGGALTISDKLAQDHILYRSGLRPGVRIVGVNGVDFADWDQTRIRNYFLENPIARDDILVIRNQDGTTRQVALGENGQLIEPVKIANASYHANGDQIYAKIRLSVAEGGEYRVLAPGSTGEEPWIQTAAGLSPLITTLPFAKPADRDFELIVQRRTADGVKQYSKNLKLPDDSLIQ